MQMQERRRCEIAIAALVTMSITMTASCGTDEDASSRVESGVAPSPTSCTSWTQLGGSPRHAGKQCAELQGMRVVTRFQIDDNPEQLVEDLGFLSEHEGHPVVDGDWVYVPIKAGYVDLFRPSTQRYGVLALKWTPSVRAKNRKLVPAWEALDVGQWSPIDVIGETDDEETTNPYAYTNAYMQMYQPILVGGSIYVPATTGGVVRLNRFTGAVLASIAPFAGGEFDDPVFTHGTNVLTASDAGEIYYTVTAFPTSANISERPRGSWLVEVHPDDSVSLTDWDAIARPPFVKGEGDLCAYQFGTAGTPPPSGPTSEPPMFRCGRQRPVFNTAIAINDEGTLIMATGHNNAVAEGKILGVSPVTKEPIWSADLLGHLRYGCGVRVPVGPAGSRCDVLTANGTTNLGADPRFNGAMRIVGYMSIMDNQIVIAPDFSLIWGSYDSGFTFGGGFDARGALLRFADGGAFLAKNESFGWEVTPALQLSANGRFTIAQDDQHFSEFDLAVARLSADFTPEVRGKIPLDFDLPAIDFLDAQVGVDDVGNIYSLSSQGLYCKFSPAGAAVDCVELLDASGARYSIETLSQYSVHVGGDMYVIHGGHMYVIEGTGGPGRPLPVDLTSQARLIEGRQARATRAAEMPLPQPPQ